MIHCVYVFRVVHTVRSVSVVLWCPGKGQLKCDGTHTETRFRLSAKRTNPFKSAGGRQFNRLLAAEVCASAVVMLDTPCSEVVWRVLATHCIRHFPLHFPSRASPCAITFQLESVYSEGCVGEHRLRHMNGCRCVLLGVVKNLKCVFYVFSWCVCGLLSLCPWLFLWFIICCLDQILFFESCI